MRPPERRRPEESQLAGLSAAGNFLHELGAGGVPMVVEIALDGQFRRRPKRPGKDRPPDKPPHRLYELFIAASARRNGSLTRFDAISDPRDRLSGGSNSTRGKLSCSTSSSSASRSSSSPPASATRWPARGCRSHAVRLDSGRRRLRRPAGLP